MNNNLQNIPLPVYPLKVKFKSQKPIGSKKP